MAKTSRRMEIVIGAKDKTKAVFRKIKSGFSSLAGAGSRLGLGISAGLAGATAALTALTAKVLESADGLAKTADKLGVTTEELSALRHAAQLGGMQIKEMDKSLQFMQRNLAEAADGMAAQKDAFDGLGLSVDKLQKMNPGDAMQEIVGALAGVENQSRKVQIAMDIFGRSGASMLNLTAEGMAAARKEAEMFGIAMSRADAKQMENINDALTRVKAALQGAAIQLVKQFAPTLEAVGNKLAEWSASGQLSKWAKDLGSFLVDVIPKGISIILTGFGHLMTVMRGWDMLLQEIKIQWLNILMLIQKGIVLAAKLSGSEELANQKKILEEIRKDRDANITKQDKLISKTEEEKQSLQKIKEEVDSFVKAIDKGTASVETQVQGVNKLADAYERAATSASKVTSRTFSGGISAEDFTKLIRQEGE